MNLPDQWDVRTLGLSLVGLIYIVHGLALFFGPQNFVNRNYRGYPWTKNMKRVKGVLEVIGGAAIFWMNLTAFDTGIYSFAIWFVLIISPPELFCYLRYIKPREEAQKRAEEQGDDPADTPQ